jgi:hypothetical protein
MILTKTKMAHQFLINVSNLTFNENNAAVKALLQALKHSDIKSILQG